MYLLSVELCIEEVKQQIHVHLGLAKQIEDGLYARSVRNLMHYSFFNIKQSYN